MPPRVAIALAVLAVAGCGGGGRAPAPTAAGPPAQRTPEPPSDEQLIEDVLRDRADALEAGDRRAYVATATRGQRRADRVAISRAAALPLRDVELDPAAIEVTGTRARTRVMERYGVDRVRGAFQGTRRVELVKAGEHWRVAGALGARGLPPWEVGRFDVHRTPHFVVLATPNAPAAELLAALETGYDAMRARLQHGLRRRYLVVAVADPAQARALTQQIHGLASLAAISDATINERGPARAVSTVVSLRLLVVSSTFARLDAEGQRRTIAHELTHAALAGSTSGRTPAWLVEGVAMYVSGDRRAAPPGGGDLAALSEPTAIARLSGVAQARAYATSSAAAFAIVDRFGTRRLLALYDAFNDPALRGQPGTRLVDRALRRELGIGLAELSG
jgi:hypothetical protein